MYYLDITVYPETRGFFSCSNQLSMKCILPVNVKVGILTLMGKIDNWY